ncbi:hypothetical protein [Flavobacterium sp.]|uniref:hypothetical protein n=1 Tax=Flavobacterium sp. TaxID=239 RepID=UPI0037C01BE6
MKSKIYLVVFNLFSFVAKADVGGDPGFPGEDDPGAPAPIDDWIVPMFIIGIILLFYYYKKYQKAEVINPQKKVD